MFCDIFIGTRAEIDPSGCVSYFALQFSNYDTSHMLCFSAVVRVIFQSLYICVLCQLMTISLPGEVYDNFELMEKSQFNRPITLTSCANLCFFSSLFQTSRPIENWVLYMLSLIHISEPTRPY